MARHLQDENGSWRSVLVNVLYGLILLIALYVLAVLVFTF